MEIFGHEYGMRYTVGAQQEIAELCPDKDLKRLKEVFGGKIAEATKAQAKLPMVLSAWNERAKSLEEKAQGREYSPAPLTWDAIEMLTPQEFGALLGEAFTVMAADSGRTVEADATGSQKKTGAAAGS